MHNEITHLTFFLQRTPMMSRILQFFSNKGLPLHARMHEERYKILLHVISMETAILITYVSLSIEFLRHARE